MGKPKKCAKPGPGDRIDAPAAAAALEVERTAAKQRVLEQAPYAELPCLMSPPSAQQQKGDRALQRATALPTTQSAAAQSPLRKAAATKPSATRVATSNAAAARLAADKKQMQQLLEAAPGVVQEMDRRIEIEKTAQAMHRTIAQRLWEQQQQEEQQLQEWESDDSDDFDDRVPDQLDMSTSSDDASEESDAAPEQGQQQQQTQEQQQQQQQTLEQVQAALQQAGVELRVPGRDSRAGRNRDAYLRKIQLSADVLPPASDVCQGFEDEPWLPPTGVGVGTTAEAHPAAQEQTAALSRALKMVCDEGRRLHNLRTPPDRVAAGLLDFMSKKLSDFEWLLEELLLLKVTVMEFGRSLPFPKEAMAAVMAELCSYREVPAALLVREHGDKVFTPHVQGCVLMAKPGRPYMVAADIGRAAGIVSTSKKKEDVLWPHGIQCADNTFVWPAKLTWVSLLRALLYALKTHCVPVEQGQWSPADLALVRAALGVWAVGFSDSLLRDLLSLAVILANVCLGDDCDDSCHLCSYMAAHARFCQALRAVHPVVHSMEAALAYIASTGHGVAGATDASAATKEKLGYAPGQTKWAAAGATDASAATKEKLGYAPGQTKWTVAGGSAGSGDFAARMKAAKRDTSDPLEVQRAKGEASAAARGQSSVRKFMTDIHAWFMENWRDEKKRGKWEAVVAALPQLKDANVDSLGAVYRRWKREQEKKEKEEKKEEQ